MICLDFYLLIKKVETYAVNFFSKPCTKPTTENVDLHMHIHVCLTAQGCVYVKHHRPILSQTEDKH